MDRVVGGKVQERWEQFDQLLMLSSLGLPDLDPRFDRFARRGVRARRSRIKYSQDRLALLHQNDVTNAERIRAAETSTSSALM